MDLERVSSSSAAVAESSQLQRLRGAVVAVVAVDDESREFVIDELQRAGIWGVGLDSAQALYRYLLESPCDIVLLDINLLGEDGYSVANFLCGISPRVGVVMLGGRHSIADMARSLIEGADLYLSSPVDIPLLLAALGSLLRRLQAQTPMVEVVQPTRSINVLDWVLSSDGWTLSSPEQRSLPLTNAERDFLSILFARRGNVVNREALIDVIAHTPHDFDPHRLDVLVHRLRARLAAITDEKLPLRAVRGKGYLFKCGPI